MRTWLDGAGSIDLDLIWKLFRVLAAGIFVVSFSNRDNLSSGLALFPFETYMYLPFLLLMDSFITLLLKDSITHAL